MCLFYCHLVYEWTLYIGAGIQSQFSSLFTIWISGGILEFLDKPHSNPDQFSFLFAFIESDLQMIFK